MCVRQMDLRSEDNNVLQDECCQVSELIRRTPHVGELAWMNKEVILLSMRSGRIHVNLSWLIDWINWLIEFDWKGRILKAAEEKFCQMLKQFSRLARFQLWDWEPFANWAQEVEPCRGAEPKQSKKTLQEFWRLPSVTIFCEEPGGGNMRIQIF